MRVATDDDESHASPGGELRCVASIEQGIERGWHRGAQVYASVGGRTILDLAVGEAGPDAPMTTDTVNMWTCAGKPIIALLVAQLWQRGEVDLDDPLRRFLEEFQGPAG